MLTHLRLADLITPVTSGATALVLCALSDWIALGFPTEPRWDVDLLALSVVLLNEECDEIVKPYEVDHLAREAHAEAIAERHRTNRIAVQTPEELWQNRMSLFPHLSFGLDVEDHLCRLGESVFREAAESFRELNRTAAAWQRTRTVRPPYASKVTPESAVTMQQYGNRRVFRDMNGEEAIYEFHARLQGGFRVHIRELPSERRIEIG